MSYRVGVNRLEIDVFVSHVVDCVIYTPPTNSSLTPSMRVRQTKGVQTSRSWGDVQHLLYKQQTSNMYVTLNTPDQRSFTYNYILNLVPSLIWRTVLPVCHRLRGHSGTSAWRPREPHVQSCKGRVYIDGLFRTLTMVARAVDQVAISSATVEVTHKTWVIDCSRRRGDSSAQFYTSLLVWYICR
jgi:hypothetical protein